MTKKIFSRKLCFDVLWLKTIIPKIDPMVPPKKVSTNKLFSEILFWCFLALRLSMPKIARVTIDIPKI